MGKYDLVVLGGGTAGLVSAAGGAFLGAKVALVERDKLGGDCLYYGCVPSKALIKSAKIASLMRRAKEFGINEVPVEVDFPAVMERMRNAIQTISPHDDPARFRKMGVMVYLGNAASFNSPHEVAVDGEVLKAKSVIIATGSHSIVPPIEGIQETGYITHVEALELKELPRSIVIVGAGPIGVEFAQLFARFGSRVTLISSRPAPLPHEDDDVRFALRHYLEADGIDFKGGYRAVSVRRENGEKVVVASNKRGESIEARGEEIFIAAGRAPTVDGLGLENAGIELDGKGIKVDEHLRTTAPNVYAAGDITGKYLFTHIADFQAKTALSNALFPVKTKINYRVIPWATFTDPEVARVGLTETEARAEHSEVQVFSYPFNDLDRAITDGETNGFVKIVTGNKGKILGGHIIGPEAGNLIHEIVLAMQNDIPVQGLSRTIHVYPTLSEGIKRASDSYYREKLFTERNRKLLGTFFRIKRLFPPW